MGDELAEPRDPNHIWLRQSVTFSVNGQTRTLEMALPLRPGATPGEVEALLDEADAGMRRLSRRLDAHLAALNGATPDPALPSAPPPAPRPAASRSATPPPAPAHSERAATPAPATAPAHMSVDLTIPEFLAEITASGLTQRQAMEKLNVRSLSGLNLRESLESLRRQMLMEGAPAPAGAPLAFEEEDGEAALAGEPEMELSYPDSVSLPDEDEEEDEEGMPGTLTASAPPASSLDALRRDARLTPAAKLPAAARRSSAPPPAEDTPAAPMAEETPAARAERILGELRALHGGGTISDHQRTAFANIVVTELNEKGVDAMARAVWNIQPEQLGPEQYDALISWGKRDHF
ncbi:MAG TPA: hypothetical protein VF808_18965, partial [Ktedonobacterales bacterium]